MNSSVFNHIAMSVPSGSRQYQTVKSPFIFSALTNITITGSGKIKAIIEKNGHMLATLFNCNGNLNIQYLHNIGFLPNDRIDIILENRDTVPQDIYVGAEIFEAIPDTPAARILFTKGIEK